MLRVRANVRPGHPWIFANEILDPPVAALPPGDAVEVADPKGRVVGRGYCNPHSLITIRLLTRGEADIDAVGFYRERLHAALALRERVLPGRRSMRLCAGEADGLPGLILDRYEDVVVAQITTLGMERRKEFLRRAVKDVIAPRGAYLRNDVGARALEGLPTENELWFGEVPDRVRFDENGIQLEANPREGQKTGFFFDQAENRRFAASRCTGATVLDVYAHVGAWALYALAAGATSATTIDASGPACRDIEANARLNGVADRLRVIESDAREAMERLLAAGERFDVVCIDPPAFAKSRKKAGIALAAYKTVNSLAAKLVKPGGLLFSSSCSHHVLPDRFEDAVVTGIRHAGRSAVLVRRGGQAPDHPILPGVPETEYLKHLAFVVR
jgi:23S rRNA (cytosine1962-C5)-methyltransferase